jgi:hypothetical protein
MQLLQDKVELETRYGKMSVPVDEVRRIEFAFRLSAEDARRIEDAAQRLGDADFNRREKALKELIEIGASAVPTLTRLSKSKDAEVARRAQEALQQLRDKLPADRMHFAEEDTVHTLKFKMTGKLIGDRLKARSTYFKDDEVLLSDLRSLRSLTHGGDSRLVIDAATHGSAPNQWLETDVVVSGEDSLRITASGQVDLWPQQPGGYVSQPSGYRQAQGRDGQFPGSLIGRIGETGKPFLIGDKYEARPSERGKLYLHIGPSPWTNASTGSYDVNITVNP